MGQLARDTPAVVLLDDHDIYHGNIWGMGGRRNTSGDDQDGGYLYDPEFIRLAEGLQAWHLPDPWDAAQPETGIGSVSRCIRRTASGSAATNGGAPVRSS